MKNPIMTIETDYGKIRIELYPKSAPNAVASVIKIAGAGLYDHREIRRIAPGFVVQPSFTCFDDPRLSMEIPDGYFAAIFARSGLAMKEGLRPPGSVGHRPRRKENLPWICGLPKNTPMM